VSTRNVVLGVVLLFIVALGFLTLSVALNSGVDILVLISLMVLAMFGFGVVGALRNPPDE
jgi:hypothetical protein